MVRSAGNGKRYGPYEKRSKELKPRRRREKFSGAFRPTFFALGTGSSHVSSPARTAPPEKLEELSAAKPLRTNCAPIGARRVGHIFAACRLRGGRRASLILYMNMKTVTAVTQDVTAVTQARGVGWLVGPPDGKRYA